MGDFVSLYTAFSGLQAAQAGMDTASHNVANAGTDGYTRQRVGLASRLPHQAPFGQIGTGVDIDDISRVRNSLLDARVRSSIGGGSGVLGGWAPTEMLIVSMSLSGPPDPLRPRSSVTI